MSDHKRKNIPADSSRVNVYERFEMEYWTKKWGCTGAQLRAAVEVTGSIMADKIEAYLRTKDKFERPPTRL